jgi:ribonucleotide reductase beta subunit family protein with ferritin-like domain
MDPLLTPSHDRLVISPIKHHDIWEMYQQAVASFWTPEEIDLSQDPTDWAKLSTDEQYFLKNILAFFAASDGIVNENLCYRFSHDIQIPEARFFYGFQVAMENIHSFTYAMLLETLVKDPEELESLLQGALTIPTIKKKADWALQWIQSSECFAERLIAFACIEAIFFSSSFCSIYWVKKRGLLPGLAFSNELISRDEGQHAAFACLLFSKLQEKPTQETILKIVTAAVEMECEFVTDILPVRLIGMNDVQMCEYVKFVADHLLVDLGLPKHYKTINPFPFMEHISLQNKTNFFEHRVGAYQKANVLSDAGGKKFTLEEDF